MYIVEATTWSGLSVIRLADTANGTAALVAPSLGANLFSLTDGDRELLRRPPDADALRTTPTRWGIPVLLPPGRIAEGRFTAAGREYQFDLRPGTNFHIHGFVLNRSAHVAAQSTGEEGARLVMEFRSADYPDVLRQFPHPFVLTITYTLKGRSLRCETRIANESEAPMPFGLGYHHYFAAPEDGTDRYEIRVEGTGKQWEMVETVPTGTFCEPFGLEDLRTWQPLHAMRRDAGYMVTEPGADGWSRAEFADRHSGLEITVAASAEYGHWVIFNGGSAPGFDGFICLEPYTCMANAFRLPLPPEVSGMRIVGPGTSQSAGEWITTWKL